MTYTSAEAAALAALFTPNYRVSTWYEYRHGIAAYIPIVTGHKAPFNSTDPQDKRYYHSLGLYFPCVIGKLKVLLIKSGLHMDYDGIGAGGVIPFYKMVSEVVQTIKPKIFITTGTGGAIGSDVKLGDVIVAASTRFDCTGQFKSQSWAKESYNTSPLPSSALQLITPSLTKTNAQRISNATPIPGRAAIGRVYAVKEKLRALIAKFANDPTNSPKVPHEKVEGEFNAADTWSTPTDMPATRKDRKERATEVTKLSLGFQNELSEAIGRILLLLTKEWALEPPAGCAGDKTADEKPKDDSKKGARRDGPPLEAPSSRAEVACAERCVCLYFLNLILIVLRRIRSLVFAVSGLFVFIVLALNSYPFEPHLQLRTGALILFLGALGSIGYVYGQIYRNRILSRVTSTSEDQLGWDFWARMAGFVAVPVLSLLAAQFPELNRVLFSWVEPALQSVR